jgi:hypothetical protein
MAKCSFKLNAVRLSCKICKEEKKMPQARKTTTYGILILLLNKELQSTKYEKKKTQRELNMDNNNDRE